MPHLPGDWDFTKTDILEEETQVQPDTEYGGGAPPEAVRIYHRAPRVSEGICIEFVGGMRVPIGDSVRIGRNFFNEVVVFGDTFISRRHAEIGNRDGKLYVIDLGSRNGTYLNGRPLPKREEAPLKPGDTILFGSTAEATVIAVEQET
ncbi:MAG: FHA domain-containing protein [Planctomycetota bacterium]|nr:FHA domain-containing protein [Planctomycetota bacterium]